MKKFESILFTTDLDGTLLRNDKSISEENIKAIEYFKEEGGLFTFVTGRVPVGALKIYDAVKPNAPCGCLNGGGIYDFSNNELLWSVEMPKTVLELVEYVDKKLPSVGIEVNTHRNIYFCKTNRSTEKHRMNESLPDLVCNYKDVKEPIAKILFANENQSDMLKLIDILNAHPKAKQFDFIRSDDEYYEILPKGVNKGNLVRKMTEMFFISPEKTIAVGDNDNDAAMLSNVHIGFAVSNGSDKAKDAADFITVSNEEDAIAKIVDDLDKGRIII